MEVLKRTVPAAMNAMLDLRIAVKEFRGAVYLSEEERSQAPQVDGPFWIVAAGGKHDFTIQVVGLAPLSAKFPANCRLEMLVLCGVSPAVGARDFASSPRCLVKRSDPMDCVMRNSN
jgi:hypothetical protein